jgi:hypothetical protein
LKLEELLAKFNINDLVKSIFPLPWWEGEFLDED